MIWPLYMRALSYAFCVVVGFGVAWQISSWRHDASDLAAMEAEQQAINQAVERERKIVELRDARLQVAAELEVERDRKAQVQERIVDREIVKYVQTPGADRCALDAGGVRILNLAAGVGVPGDPGAAASIDAGTR